MKPALLFLAISCLSTKVLAQFPAPTNFAVTIEYVSMGGMGWTDCGGTTLYAPAYCTHMSWSTPDTNSTESKLIEYQIYQDNVLLCSANKKTEHKDMCSALTGNFYITAIYGSPNGVSGQSNLVVVSNNLPLGLKDISDDNGLMVVFNESDQRFEISSPNLEIERLTLFDSNGKMLKVSRNTGYLSAHDLQSGIYIIEISYKHGRTQSRKIQIN